MNASGKSLQEKYSTSFPQNRYNTSKKYYILNTRSPVLLVSCSQSSDRNMRKVTNLC